MYRISNSNGLSGQAWSEEYASEAEALAALCEAFNIDPSDAVTSERYTVDGGSAVSVYDSQEACDADQEGAYAPRIIWLDE